MAARANSLTARATTPSGRPESAWTMATNDVRAFAAAFERLGYDVNSLLTAAGLRESDLADPDGRISCDVLGRFMEGAQRSRFTPNLALELARATPLGAFPLLDYLVLTADTVGGGVRQLALYYRLVGNPLIIEIDDDADPVRLVMTGTAAAFSAEFVASLIVLHFRSETDGRFAAAGITFQHHLDDVSGFEQRLGCPVTDSGSWNGVAVPLAAWRLPLRRRDPVLRRMLESHADDIVARLPSRHGVALEVQRALTPRVAGGDTRISSLARDLGMSGRTLQRRLAAEGVSFQELLDDARKEAAGRCLSESRLTIGEVAYLVGYSEPAPFHRAFKRWFGVTPERFRQQRRDGSVSTFPPTRSVGSR